VETGLEFHQTGCEQWETQQREVCDRRIKPGFHSNAIVIIIIKNEKD